MDKIQKLFLNLLLPEPERGLLEDIEPGHKEWIFETAKAHSLFALVFSQIERFKNELNGGFYTAFTSSYKRAFLTSAVVSALQEKTEKEILSTLESSGIPAVVIKGNSLAKRIYGDPNSRTSTDIDILIKREDAERAEDALLSLGLEPEEDMPLRYCLSRIHHATYHHPETKQGVEIHWSFGIPYLFDLGSEDIWREVKRDAEGLSLSDEMTLLMLLIHHHSHSFRELRILTDILWVLHRLKNRSTGYRIEKLIEKAGLRKVYGLTIGQIQDVWPQVREDEKLNALFRISENMELPGVIKGYFTIRLEGQKGGVHLYRDKFIARFLLKNMGRTLTSFFRTLLPPAVAVEEIYGKSTILNHLRFILWRLKDWTGTGRKSHATSKKKSQDAP
ncbi:MAG: hypothetical protein D6726_02090 [Nitrospirae bacterium]|nr:MAG: hypothetical protein D6726_02090 [Nitrospirota bacterium]